MIKFFRHIRQRMIKENRISKYLLYAIGEIILVVIGILIALSLNNWNTEQKERALELKTLNELQASFLGDLEDLNFNLKSHEEGLFACQQLLVAFENEVPYSDRLDSHFGQFYNVSVLVHSTGAYETLKSRGMDIISNDGLRRQVVRMYDLIYNEILENQRNFDFVDLQENKHFMFEHMTDWKFFQSAKPRDYDMISKDPVFRNRLEYTVQSRSLMISRYENAKAECEKVIQALEKEVERLSE
jgi:hypothetical protein